MLPAADMSTAHGGSSVTERTGPRRVAHETHLSSRLLCEPTDFLIFKTFCPRWHPVLVSAAPSEHGGPGPPEGPHSVPLRFPHEPLTMDRSCPATPWLTLDTWVTRHPPHYDVQTNPPLKHSCDSCPLSPLWPTQFPSPPSPRTAATCLTLTVCPSQLPLGSENPVRGALCLVDGAGAVGGLMVSRCTTAPNDTEHIRSCEPGICADAAGRPSQAQPGTAVRTPARAAASAEGPAGTGAAPGLSRLAGGRRRVLRAVAAGCSPSPRRARPLQTRRLLLRVASLVRGLRGPHPPGSKPTPDGTQSPADRRPSTPHAVPRVTAEGATSFPSGVRAVLACALRGHRLLTLRVPA